MELKVITELEKQILLYFYNKGFEFIARGTESGLQVYSKKPVKVCEYGYWLMNGSIKKSIRLDIFEEEFSFVGWEDEEPTSIEYVLENYVVVEE